jgi:hypothetical protein
MGLAATLLSTRSHDWVTQAFATESKPPFFLCLPHVNSAANSLCLAFLSVGPIGDVRNLLQLALFAGPVVTQRPPMCRFIQSSARLKHLHLRWSPVSKHMVLSETVEERRKRVRVWFFHALITVYFLHKRRRKVIVQKVSQIRTLL